MSTTNSPLAKLASAEQFVITTVRAAADRIDAIGTNDLAGALDNLQRSADAARARLTNAYGKVNSIVGDVLDNLNDLAGALAEQLGEPVAVQAVEPLALPAPVATKVEVEPTICAGMPSASPIASNAPALPAPSSASPLCSVCGFLPRKNATVCCGVPVGDRPATVATIAPPVIDLALPIGDVLAAIVAPHASDSTQTITAQDLTNGTAFSPDGAQAPPAAKRRRGKASANGTAP